MDDDHLVKRLYTKVSSYVEGDGLRAHLLRGGLGSLVVKVVSSLVNFVLVVLLARTLGPGEYGVYTFALSLIMLLTIPAQLGLPQLIVRETAKAHTRKNWALMIGLWRWSIKFIVFSTSTIILLGLLILWLGFSWIESMRWYTLLAGLLLVPFIALANIQGATLRGLRYVVLGQLPEQILRPAILTFLVLVLVWSGSAMSAVFVMGTHGAAAVGAFAIGMALLKCVHAPAYNRDLEPIYEGDYWRRTMLPLAMLAGLQLINSHADILMLGTLRSDREVGVYRVVVQMATLVVFGLSAFNQILQPYFARLYEQNDMLRLQKLATYSARIILSIALPPVVIMVAAGKPLLGFFFGEGYSAGATSLAILAIGQLVNASMGSVGVLLNMTGHERDTMYGIGVAAGANVILNIILIPRWGIEGAATSTAITLFVWNFLLRRAVKRKLSIETSALG
ncbi:flippase [Kineobactrum salinum]|uniref:flippase n=1 Tax=Kineobactrum salinum TaxID=2708301 RepID=UPI0018D6E384|nr:flippase [Kineobactrum salinum]